MSFNGMNHLILIASIDQLMDLKASSIERNSLTKFITLNEGAIYVSVWTSSIAILKMLRFKKRFV